MPSKTSEIDYEKLAAALAPALMRGGGASDPIDQSALGLFDTLLAALKPLEQLRPSHGELSKAAAAHFTDLQRAWRRADVAKAERPPDCGNIYLTFVVDKGSRK
jgi:hypothetical protein